MNSNNYSSHLKSFFLPLIGVLLITVGVLSLLRTMGHREESKDGSPRLNLKVGDTLPDWNVHLIDGKSVRISAIPAKVLFINFWAEWCSGCMIELPSIIALWKTYHSQGLEVLGINLDENPSVSIPRVTKKLGISFLMGFDDNQILGDALDLHEIPYTLLVDQQRKILRLDLGERNWNSASDQAQIKQWLKI